MPKPRVVRHGVTQPQNQSYRLIPLTQGQTAIVDVEDFEWLSQWNWYAQWNQPTRSFYAVRTCKNIRMHREILRCEKGKDTDHINHDTLDNRRFNLRKCNRSQNVRNQRKRIGSRSIFKGVTFGNGKWRVRICTNYKRIHIGYYNTEEEAAQAYNAAAKEKHGKFAYLN